MEGYSDQLARLRYELPIFQPYMNCRPFEMMKAVEKLRRERVVWLLAEFDMGGDDFLSTVKSAMDLGNRPVFCIDLKSFEGLEDLAALRTITMDGDINGLCERLSLVGPCFVILDGADFSSGNTRNGAVQVGVKELSNVLIEYCPEIMVFVRYSIRSEVPGIESVVLHPLDEAECKVYVDLHPDCQNVSEANVTSGALYGYTSGAPGRIDRTLRLLGYDTFENLVNGSSSQSVDDGVMLPESMIRSIDLLRSEEGLDARTYELLVALTFFPYGERINTLKYFKGSQRIRSAMADRLVAMGLADMAESVEIGTLRGEQERFIVLKSSVLQFMYRAVEVELKDYYEEAAKVYFGRDWRLGEPKFNLLPRKAESKIGAIVEQNANLIILRLLSDALEDRTCSPKELYNRIKVFSGYVGRLDQDDRYLYVVKICGPGLMRLESHADHHLVQDVRFKYARALRMLGKHSESLREFQLLLNGKQTADRRASIHVNMAFSHERMGDVNLARISAENVLALKVKGEPLYNARSVLIGISDDSQKYKKLERLADKARREKCYVSANNIQLELIGELSDPMQRKHGYLKMLEVSTANGDIYNAYRSVTYFSELAVETDEGLSERQFKQLLNAYKYACSQRQSSLFNLSHASLWTWLERLDQLPSLFQLFRHSSLLQRLSNKVSVEQEYLDRLLRCCKEEGFSAVRKSVPQDLYRYVMVRAMTYRMVSLQELGRDDGSLIN